MHRSSIAVAGESAASYALVKLIPAGGGAGPLALNLALVLDVSGSMYEEDGTGVSRLSRIQQAAISAIQKLKPDDTLAIVAFAHNCQVILPSTPLSRESQDRGRDPEGRHVRRRSGRHGHGRGHPHRHEPRSKRRLGGGKLSQLIVLTDGETSGEQNCRQLAKEAGRRRRSASTSSASAPSGTRASSRTWPSWPRATGATSTSTT